MAQGKTSSKPSGKAANAKAGATGGQRRGGRSSSSGPRRRPTEGLPKLQHDVRMAWRRVLELWILWLVIFVVVSTWSLLPRSAFLVPRVEEGSIASRTILADADLSVPNESATAVLQRQAQEAVPPIYDFDTELLAERRQQLAALFEAGRAASGQVAMGATHPGSVAKTVEGTAPDGEGEAVSPLEPADLQVWLQDASPLQLSPQQVELLEKRQFSTELEDRLGGVLARVLRQGVVSDKEILLQQLMRGITVQDLPSGRQRVERDLSRYLDYPDHVRQAVEQDLLSWDGLSSRERRAMVDLIVANVSPNLTFNVAATRSLQDEVASAVGTVAHTIRKGEVVVRRGERVDELAARAVTAMAGTRDVSRLLLSGLGTVALLLAAALLVWLTLAEESRRDRSRKRQLNECLMLLTLHLLGVRFGYFVAGAIAGTIAREPYGAVESYAYAIPFASLALASVLLYGRNTALVLSLVFSLLVGQIAGGDAVWRTAVYAVASSLAAVYALDHHQFKQRSAMIRAGTVVGLVNAAALLTLGAMRGGVEGGIERLGFDLLCGFAGGLLASAVASFSVPILENLLSITTSIKLVELANPNLPMLRRLALEAPGTFQHSLAVANLAKAGCEAIDGDALLINTTALYHDIGKIFRPHYFIENQQPGQNPHDKIQPSMSALILINHVKEGLDLAHRHNLPRPVLDAIGQHHGTRLIKFFYNRAKERCDPETEEVREEEFRYPGPKPQSKEMGVLMLADAVEAASRTLVDPSRQKILSVLKAVFSDCLEDDQLDQTDLTLGDLRRVEDAFVRVLTNIHHRRIDYPGFDFNKPGGGRKSRREESAVVSRRDFAAVEVESREDEAGDPGLGDPGPGDPGPGEPNLDDTEATRRAS